MKQVSSQGYLHLAIFAVLLQAALSATVNQRCPTSEAFQVSLSVQTYAMSHGKLGTIPKIGLQIAHNMSCPLREYVTNYGVRFFDIPQNLLPSAPLFEMSQEFFSVLKSINDLLVLKNDLFYIRLDTNDTKTIEGIEHEILESQRTTFPYLNIAPSNQVGEFLHENLSEYDFLNADRHPNVILFQASGSNTEFTISPAMLQQNSFFTAKNLTVRNLTVDKLESDCSIDDFVYPNQFGIIYTNSSPKSDDLLAATRCGLTVIYENLEKSEKEIQDAYIFLVLKKGFDEANEGCFYAQIESANLNHQLFVLHFTNDCGAKERVGRRLLCREDNEVKFEMEQKIYKNTCKGSGYVTLPQTSLEAQGIIGKLQKKVEEGDLALQHGVWVDLIVERVTTNQITWNGGVPSYKYSVYFWKRSWFWFVKIGVMVLIAAFIIYKRIQIRKYRNLEAGGQNHKEKKENEMREVKLQFDELPTEEIDSNQSIKV